MKRALALLAIVGSGIAATVAAGPDGAKAADAERVKRGEYLVIIGACHDCHTPMVMTPDGPAPDMTRMLIGHPEGAKDPEGTLGASDLALSGPDLTAWKQPFGLVYTRNLTPDKTGLADWTEEQFVNAIRRGRHQGDGRALLPPMPWMHYAAWSDEDAKSVFAYLRTIPAIRNAVPDPRVPPPVIEHFSQVNQKIAEGVSARWHGPAKAAK